MDCNPRGVVVGDIYRGLTVGSRTDPGRQGSYGDSDALPVVINGVVFNREGDGVLGFVTGKVDAEAGRCEFVVRQGRSTFVVPVEVYQDSALGQRRSG